MPLSKYNLTRKDYEDAFKKELQSKDINDENIEVILMNLWYNSMRSGGLRLTKRGYDILTKNLTLESWKLDVEDQVSINELLVLLDKHLDSPYFIHPRKHAAQDKEAYYHCVSIFANKVAVAAGLMGLYHYLQMEEKRKKRLT